MVGERERDVVVMVKNWRDKRGGRNRWWERERETETQSY